MKKLLSFFQMQVLCSLLKKTDSLQSLNLFFFVFTENKMKKILHFMAANQPTDFLQMRNSQSVWREVDIKFFSKKLGKIKKFELNLLKTLFLRNVI